MTEEQLEKEKVDTSAEFWIKHLMGDGLKQKYRYWDDGGESVKEKIFDLTRGDKPYFVGYIGQH